MIRASKAVRPSERRRSHSQRLARAFNLEWPSSVGQTGTLQHSGHTETRSVPVGTKISSNFAHQEGSGWLRNELLNGEFVHPLRVAQVIIEPRGRHYKRAAQRVGLQSRGAKDYRVKLTTESRIGKTELAGGPGVTRIFCTACLRFEEFSKRPDKLELISNDLGRMGLPDLVGAAHDGPPCGQ